MNPNPYPYSGLTDDQVNLSRQAYGLNIINGYDRSLWIILKKAVSDPIFIFLSLATFIYFSSRQLTEAFFMTISLGIVVSISIYQERRSSKALAALKKMSAPKTKVIRNNSVGYINNSEVVVGDYLVAEEGTIM